MIHILFRISFLFFFLFTHLHGQYSIDLGCKDESEAFIGLDRKAWTSDINAVSESYQINFDIPDNQAFSCALLEWIEVSINGFSATNNIPPACFLWLWTHALNCSDNTAISCSDILFDQQGLSTQFAIDGADITEGTTIGIDIVVVVDVTNLSCIQDAINNGLYDASFEICLEAFYIPDEVEEPLDLGEDITVCQGEIVDLEGPDDFEIYEWEGPIDSDEQLLENAIPGLYFLEVTDSNGCRSSDDILIDIIEMDSILFDKATNLIFCHNNPDTINVLNYQGSQFDIEWSNQFGQLGTDSEIIPDTSGIYTVMVTDTDTDCTVSTILNVSIIESNSAEIIGNNLICENGNTVLTALLPDNDSIEYKIEWFIDQDTISTDTLIVSQEGMIILSLTDTLQCGTSFDTLNIIQNIPLSAGLNNSASICIGDSIEFNSLLSPGVQDFGSWFNFATGTPEFSAYYTSENGVGSYDYIYVIENPFPCTNDTAFFQITVSDSDVFAGLDHNASYCPEESFSLESLITGDPGGWFEFESGTTITDIELMGSDLNAGTNIIYYIIDSGSCGRDSALITINIFETIPETIISDIICPDESITINNTQYDINNQSGSEFLNSIFGCDSLIIVELNFHDIAENFVTDQLCRGDSILIDGEYYDEFNSTASIVLFSASANGCDSMININLSFIDYVDTLINLQLCENQSISIANEVFDTSHSSGIITLPNGAINGCDSIINVDLDFTSSIVNNIQTSLCPEEEISVDGTTFDINNPIGSVTLLAANGCDSIVEVDLSFYNTMETDLTLDLCDDETIQIGTEIYGELNQGGVSILENSDINGCDSLVNVIVKYGQSSESFNAEAICENDSIFIVDEWISEPGTYTDYLIAANGCDSIINTEISLMVCSILVLSNVQNESCFNENDGIIEVEIPDSNQFPFEYILQDEMSNTIEAGMINGNSLVTISGLNPGMFSFTILKNGQEVLLEEFEILEANPILINENITNIQCFGDNNAEITISPEGGSGSLSVLWDTGESN